MLDICFLWYFRQGYLITFFLVNWVGFFFVFENSVMNVSIYDYEQVPVILLVCIRLQTYRAYYIVYLFVLSHIDDCNIIGDCYFAGQYFLFLSLLLFFVLIRIVTAALLYLFHLGTTKKRLNRFILNLVVSQISALQHKYYQFNNLYNNRFCGSICIVCLRSFGTLCVS